ncbi:MAG: F510_1955 family glycosylhydrolase [Cyanobacteriota bacterium]
MSQPDTHKQNSQITKNTAIGYAAPIVVFLLLLGGVGVLFGCSSQPQATNQPVSNQSTTQTQETAANSSLEPAVNWRTDNHVHGLTVNPDNPKVLYVATHNGLVKRSETGEWFWMEPDEKERADYMGFTAHPTDPKRFYASGHPHTGGNLGFQVTENLGQDWKQISMPGVDFHAIAIAPSNPNVFYAWPASGAQGFHTSTDGGKTWTKPRMTGLEAAPFSLAVDPHNSVRVFATTRAGLYESTNGGNDWTLVSNTQDAPVVGLALLTEGDNTVMIGYRLLKSAPGLYRSADGGKTWKQLGTTTKGTVLYLAIASNNPQILYAVNENNAIFQSQDSGKTWKELG